MGGALGYQRQKRADDAPIELDWVSNCQKSQNIIIFDIIA